MLIAFGLFLGPIFWTGIVWLGNAALFAGLAALAYHAALWLLDGTWTGLSFGAVLVATGLADLSPSSSGPDGVAQAIMAFPVALGAIGAGLVVMGIGSAARAAANKRERDQTRKSIR